MDAEAALLTAAFAGLQSLDVVTTSIETRRDPLEDTGGTWLLSELEIEVQHNPPGMQLA